MKDFTIYHPLKCNGKYQCTPYSFVGTIEAISNPKELMDFLKNSFYSEKECKIWIKNREISIERLDD